MKQGWEIKKLGEVCEIQGGSTPKRTESSFWDNGTYPWFTIEDIREQGHIISDTKQKITKIAWDKMRIFPKDTILLCCTASLGEYAITQIPLSSNQQFNGLTIKDKNYLSPMYLMHYCSTLKNTLLSLSGKATIDFVSAEKVRQIPIPVPPRAEQERIVAELDCLSGVIEKKREQLRELDALAQSIFYQMFGDPITNEKSWEVKKWGDLFDTILGKMLDKKKQVETDVVLPYIANTNVQWGYFILDDLKTMTFSDKERIKLKLELGDILICEGGESGRCAVWNGANEEILFQKAIHRARVKNGSTIMPMFVSILLKEIKLNGGLKDYISKSTIEHLTGEKLNLVPIICPPLILQQEFANKIEAIEKQKELIKKSISETETLFNARMDYYFN